MVYQGHVQDRFAVLKQRNNNFIVPATTEPRPLFKTKIV